MADEDYDSESDDEVEQQLNGGLHEQFIEMLVAEVERERYPSSHMLDLLESCMTPRDRVRIANALLDNLARHRYPSHHMLRRLARLVG